MSSWLLLGAVFPLPLPLSLPLFPSFFVVRNLPKERTNGQPLTSPAFVFPFRHFVFPFNIYISLCEAGEAKRKGKQKRRLMKNAQQKKSTKGRKWSSGWGIRGSSRFLRHSYQSKYHKSVAPAWHVCAVCRPGSLPVHFIMVPILQ